MPRRPLVRHLGGERVWPRFGPRAGRFGVDSARSLPLLLPGQVVGAINVCTRAEDVFDELAQAIGVLRARRGGTTEEAFARLREMSQREHPKVVEVAQRLVDEAVGRARARHVDG